VLVPPSREKKVFLRFETNNGVQFDLSVDQDISIARLKREILVEENIDAKHLKALVFPPEPEHPDDNETLVLEELNDDAKLSSFPLKSQVIVVNSMFPLLCQRDGCLRLVEHHFSDR
jgi:hypothetical protein